jgi:hypothetical protein
MWTIEQRVGRLIEIRIASPIQLPDLEGFGQRITDIVTRGGPRSQRFISCTDVSAANIFPPDVAEWFIKLMYRDNPVLERGAFLTGASAVFALQIERMFKQSSSVTRRTFRETAPLIDWLGEVATAAERERLRSFLAEGGHL